MQILANAPLVAIFGPHVYGTALPQGVMSAPAPVRALTVQRVSTMRPSHQGGIIHLVGVRIQFTSWCKGAQSELDALNANKAIVDFLNTFCATSTALFDSPPTTPAQFPNFVLNELVKLWPETQPPLYLGVVDARIYNREDL